MNGLLCKDYTFTKSDKVISGGSIPVSKTQAMLTTCVRIFYRESEFQYTQNRLRQILFPPSLEDKNLTMLAMAVSEKSLGKDWEDEDDARWESFLNE
jgi:hypothetical protein